MNFSDAMSAVLKGGKMTRPHWCWCYVVKIDQSLVVEHDDLISHRDHYAPSHQDKRATDWQEYADLR